MAKTLLYRIATGITIGLVGWIAFISWQEWQRHERINQEVAKLDAEAEKIKSENESFSERISYFSSDSFREQEAKQKLGLKKTNETVVAIKPAPAAAAGGTATPTQALETASRDDDAHYRMWWRVFFE